MIYVSGPNHALEPDAAPLLNYLKEEGLSSPRGKALLSFHFQTSSPPAHSSGNRTAAVSEGKGAPFLNKEPREPTLKERRAGRDRLVNGGIDVKFQLDSFAAGGAVHRP